MAKILIVDDEVMIRKILADFFTKMGFDILQAAGGQEALEFLKKDKEIDLMILDLKMPLVNGFDVLRLKRDLKDERPVIILTGTVSQVKNFLNLQEFGIAMEDVLYKPFDLFVILSIVNQRLNIKN